MTIRSGAKIQIITPPSPTPRELFAAEELEKYLKRSLNVRLVESASCDVRIIIGGPLRNPSCPIPPEEFSSLLTGEEGMLIDIRGRDIVIAGSEGFDDMERGTVYAVYEFLERYLGCSLTAYSSPTVEAGELVPTYDSIELKDDRYVKPSASRPYRTAIVEYGDKAGDSEHELNIPFFDWLVKNRYNRILTWCKIYDGYKKMGLIPELLRRGIRLTVGHHDAIDYWLPFFGNELYPEHYLETHPEYYRLNSDGTRFKPRYAEDPAGQWVLCSRNEECINQVSDNLSSWIEDNPYVDCIALWPKDGRAEQCTCPMCSPYTKMQNYTYFLNKIATRVGTKHKKIKLDVLLYTNLWTYPEGTEIPENVFYEMSTWADSGLRSCGKPDGSCLINTHFTDTLLEWQSHGASVGFYDYYMGVFGARQRLIPMADELQSIWQYFEEKNILGTGTQLECFHIWNHLVNVCSFGRTAYDTSLSLEDNLSRIGLLFGEGAPFVSEIVRYVETLNDGEANISAAGRALMEKVDKSYVYNLYEKALTAAKSTLSRNNIRLMRMVFRYSDLETSDTGARPAYSLVLPYDDPTGELAYMAVSFDSLYHSKTGYAVAFPVLNTDTKGFIPGKWYIFE
ncbi:MAG: DUF4838 domain-containing protein [Clostridia bacterium]|nr:DUF4838 domain-containing protein [Clostridia bacterium]